MGAGESANSETAILGQDQLDSRYNSMNLFTPSGMAPRLGSAFLPHDNHHLGFGSSFSNMLGQSHYWVEVSIFINIVAVPRSS